MVSITSAMLAQWASIIPWALRSVARRRFLKSGLSNYNKFTDEPADQNTGSFTFWRKAFSWINIHFYQKINDVLTVILAAKNWFSESTHCKSVHQDTLVGSKMGF